MSHTDYTQKNHSGTVTCRSDKCKARIRFIKRKNGKMMPVDAERVSFGVDSPANIDRIATKDGDILVNPPQGTEGFVPHHITCKDVDRFRERRGK